MQNVRLFSKKGQTLFQLFLIPIILLLQTNSISQFYSCCQFCGPEKPNWQFKIQIHSRCVASIYSRTRENLFTRKTGIKENHSL